jgi:predicted DNA-binding transcriptional regulator AlpA
MSRRAKLADQGADLMGASEAAAELGVHRPTLVRWVREGKFPKPLKSLAATPVWAGKDIRAFKRQRERTKAKQLARRAAREAEQADRQAVAA